MIVIRYHVNIMTFETFKFQIAIELIVLRYAVHNTDANVCFSKSRYEKYNTSENSDSKHFILIINRNVKLRNFYLDLNF